MNKVELIAKLAEKTKSTKAEAERALDALIGTIETTIKSEGKLTLTGFGTFEVVSRAARIGRNPSNGKEINIPASKVVKFKVGKTLKDAIK